MRASLLAAFLLACSSTAVPADMAADVRQPDIAAPDLSDGSSSAPALLSVAPKVVKVGTDPVISVDGNAAAALDVQQAASWKFGACVVSAYTYAPINAQHCTLQLQIPLNAPPASCDLSLKRADGALLVLKSAFSVE